MKHPNDPLLEGEVNTLSAPLDYSSMTKADIQSLLDERGVEWTTNMLKDELIQLAKESE